MRRLFVCALAFSFLLSGCSQREDRRVPFPTTVIDVDSVPVKFNFAAGGVPGVTLRFPVFWGTYRGGGVVMRHEGDHFTATVDLPLGGILQYEYGVETYDYDHRELVRAGEPPLRHVLVEPGLVLEDEAYVFGPGTVDRPAHVYGNVTDASTGEPVLEPLIVADGLLTGAMNGAYDVAVRDRSLRVTVYTLDGSYKPQTRWVQPGEADFALEPAPPAHVTFRVDAHPPEHHRVRVYGSTEQFGLIQTAQNRFLQENYLTVGDTWSLELHEGQWVDYLYTVGNTAYSYENHDGTPVIRSFVAKDGFVVDDHVGDFLQDHTVTFRVHTPSFTDPHEVIGFRQDPRTFDMHPVGDHDWVLEASGEVLEGRPYRYYRTWTGIGDEATIGRTVHGDAIDDTVEAWKFLTQPIPTEDFSVPPIANKFRLMPFIPDWWSGQHAHYQADLTDHFAVEGLHGFLPAQVWGYETLEPTTRIVRDRPITLYTPQYEMKRIVDLAHAQGLEVAVTPQLGLPDGYGPGHPFPAAWWPQYLAELERFNLHMARSAEAAGVDYLEVIGKSPFFDAPADVWAQNNAAMAAMFPKVRALYSGNLLATYNEFESGADWWKNADYIMQLNYPVGLDGNATQDQIDAKVRDLFETKYKPQVEAAGRSLVIKIGVHSVDGAAGGREVPESDGPVTENNAKYPLDAEEQRMIYEAYYKAASRYPWVHAFFPFVHGYVDGPQTRDVDVRGKPADALTSSWARAMGDL
jgi:glycosyl hydrolase family 113